MTPPLLFLPGMMCDARLFLPQIAALSGERSVAVAPLCGAQTIEAIAARVLAQAPPTFALAGLSMGGIVALDIMRQAPDRVSHLALMDTTPLADAPDNGPVREGQVQKVRAGGLHAVMRDELKPAYLADGPNRGAVLDTCMMMAQDLGASVFEDQSVALQHRRDRRGILPQIAVPTLVACGRDDKLCPLDRHKLMAALIPGADLQVIDGAGHLPPLEQPEKTTQLLQQWLCR